MTKKKEFMNRAEELMIVIDTREQLPLWTARKAFVRSKKLDVGDYTIPELFGKAHIERKSPNDLYGSVIQGHDRFRNELIRSWELGIKLAVFVECTKDNFYGMKWDSRGLKCPGETLRKIVEKMELKYAIPFIFCDGRVKMKKAMLEWFDNQRKVDEVYGEVTRDQESERKRG